MTTKYQPSESDAFLPSSKDADKGIFGRTKPKPCYDKAQCNRSIVIPLIATLVGLVLFVRIHEHPTRPQASWKDTFLNDAMRFDPDDDDKFYTGTQFISFTINTMGGSAAHDECGDRQHVDPETGTCYLGDFDIENDIHQRVKIIQQVLKRLKQDRHEEKPKINHDTNVLKVFMMPEFFMRGPHGAYATTQIMNSNSSFTTPGLLIQASAKIRNIIADDYFKNYLFVFGTAIYAQVDDDQPDKPWWEYNDLNATEVLYYNFAPVFKGGTGHNHYYIVSKKYMSIGDFLKRSTLPDPSALKQYATIQESDFLEDALAEGGTTLVDNHLIEIDGIRFGLEICLDHLLGALWESLQTQEHSQLVDVHLITSAGMAIEAGPTPIVPGGVVYMSDGEASSAACIRTDHYAYNASSVCQTPPNGPKHIPIVEGGDFSTFIMLESCIDQTNIELEGFYSTHLTQGCAYTLSTYGIDVMDKFKYYPPSIEIYPTVDLPKKTGPRTKNRGGLA
jgi:hypothetical protein